MRSFQTFETLPRTYIPASDRILWLWLILTESELWRTLDGGPKMATTLQRTEEDSGALGEDGESAESESSEEDA